MSSLPSTSIPTARKDPQEFHEIPQLAINYFAMNYLTKPFDDIHIRQAFALAINREYITHTIFNDTNFPTYHIIPSGMLGYDPNLTGPAGVSDLSDHPNLAKQLLQQGLREEGWSSVRQLPPITLTYENDSGDSGLFDLITTVIREWQSVLGIGVKVNLVNFNSLTNEMDATTNNPHGLQFWSASWLADYPDPQNWTTLQFDKNSPLNAENYGQNMSTDSHTQQQLQQMLEAADTNQDPVARLKAYHNAEQQLVNDVAWMPVYQFPVDFMLKTYVHGITFNPLNLILPDDWVNILIDTH